MIAEEQNHRKDERREEILISAYLTAKWQRADKLPSLKQILKDSKSEKQEPKGPQTPEQILAAVKHIHAQLSGEEG